jgi:hypothetical protein
MASPPNVAMYGTCGGERANGEHDSTYTIVQRDGDDGTTVKCARIPMTEESIRAGVPGWIFYNLRVMSTPPPPYADPTGLTGIGYGDLEHPHTKYCVGNPSPHLGEYVYPLAELLRYFALDGLPPGVSDRDIRSALMGLLNKFATDDASLPGPPSTIAVVV